MMNTRVNPPILQYESLAAFTGCTLGPTQPIVVFLLEHEEVIDDYTLGRLFDWTSVDIERVSRFRHQGAKTSWCLSRLLYRNVLSNAAGIDPSDISIRYGKHGKPYLPDTTLCFNWSHTSGCVALAVADTLEIGCDIEDLNRLHWQYSAVLETFFTIEERSWVCSETRADSQWRRFLSLFVQKEARLKKIGTGLAESLHDVRCVLEEPPFHDATLCCFRHGREERYITAVCTSKTEGEASRRTDLEASSSIALRSFRLLT